MAARVKITPRIAPDVARRLRLASAARAKSMSALVNETLNDTLPSLEDILFLLGGQAGKEAGGDDGHG